MPSSTPTSPYQLIKARSTSFGGVFKLYWGDDHVLMVEANGFNERYRRFYYRDIMAVYHTPSRRLFWMGLGTGILTALLLIITLGVLTVEPVASGVLFIPTALLATAFIINLAKGKSCSCYLKTAVKEHELPPLARVTVADRFIAELLPRIATAQGVTFTPIPDDRTSTPIAAETTPSPLSTATHPNLPPTPQASEPVPPTSERETPTPFPPNPGP